MKAVAAQDLSRHAISGTENERRILAEIIQFARDVGGFAGRLNDIADQVEPRGGRPEGAIGEETIGP